MNKNNKRYPKFFTDENGIERARVPLPKVNTFALVDGATLRQLMALGISTSWCVKRDGYVAVNIPGSGQVTVARLLTGAGANERVSYSDGDKLNMHGENLKVMQTHVSKIDLSALLAMQSELRMARAGTEQLPMRAPTKTVGQLRAEMWDALAAEGTA